MTKRTPSKRTPWYTDRNKTYHADRCKALADACSEGLIRLETLVHGHYPGCRLPAKLLPEIKTVGFWDTDIAQSWGLDWHRNEGIEIAMLERGTLDFATADIKQRLKPDDFTITRPWQEHRLGAPHIDAGRLHWLILDVGVRRPHQKWKWPSWIVLTQPDLDELTRALRQNEQPVWRATPEFRQCFQKIARSVSTASLALSSTPSSLSQPSGESAGIAQASRLIVHINELMLLLLEMSRDRDMLLDESLTDTQRTVELFLNDLRDNRESIAEPWTASRMAKACGLGITRFTDYCRQLTNLAPIQYLNQLRLQTAERLLLEEPQLTVAEIARQTGFASSQYFATVFRRQYESSPREYRERHGDG